MNATEKEMISQIACDIFGIAEREAQHQRHTHELIEKMAMEEFPMNRKAA
jgi:hypothetical protein